MYNTFCSRLYASSMSGSYEKNIKDLKNGPAISRLSQVQQSLILHYLIETVYFK